MLKINKKKKIDRRKTYFLILDIETTGGFDCPLAYDLGFTVIDRNGKIYEKESCIIQDIFQDKPILMKSAYYKEKIPLYWKKIKNKSSKVYSFLTVWRHMNYLIKQYRIGSVGAYNSTFDTNGLDSTISVVSMGMIKKFLPSHIQVFCIWHMACQTIYLQKGFLEFAIKNGFVSDKGNIMTSAEVGYKYHLQNTDYQEEHMGLDDVLIEGDIFVRVLRQHKKVDWSANQQCWKLPTQKAKELNLL